MTVKQISVFIENKPGRLAEFTKLLQKNEIDIRALSLADGEDFGILRIIVEDSYKAACVLKEENMVFSVTPVLAIEIADEPGSLGKVLELLGETGVNIQYTYAFITRKKDSAYMIMRVADNEKAIEVLTKHGIRPVCQDELSGLFR